MTVFCPFLGVVPAEATKRVELGREVGPNEGGDGGGGVGGEVGGAEGEEDGGKIEEDEKGGKKGRSGGRREGGGGGKSDEGEHKRLINLLKLADHRTYSTAQRPTSQPMG